MRIPAIIGAIPRTSSGISAPKTYCPRERGTPQVQYGVRYCFIKPNSISRQRCSAKIAQHRPWISSCTTISTARASRNRAADAEPKPPPSCLFLSRNRPMPTTSSGISRATAKTLAFTMLTVSSTRLYPCSRMVSESASNFWSRRCSAGESFLAFSRSSPLPETDGSGFFIAESLLSFSSMAFSPAGA